MNAMPLTLDWSDCVGRVLIALVAGALIGLNRGESGNAAGLRTTLLVCLAACLAMLQVNVLMLQHGKPQDSFVVLDLMRLPLGILSGVGFIGAGSILRKDGLVQGVTTAATMWYVTMIGLCAGGGQYTLAIAGTVLGLLVLQTFEYLERWIPRGRRARVVIGYDAGHDASGIDSARHALDEALRVHACRVLTLGVARAESETLPHGQLNATFEVRWQARPGDDAIERTLGMLVARMHDKAEWSIER